MNKATLMASACAAVMALPPAAFAQTDGDIIVTARKREESILQVPVIETVITKEQIERTQVTDLYDIGSMTPGVVLGLGSLEVGTQVSIRGVGTSSLDPGIDQSTALNLDGLNLTQGSAYSVGVFDMAQVEVLKGPQALFYGKNSPAGVIAIRTNDPGDELEVIGRLGYESVAKEWRTEGIVSGPLGPSAGLRLAARYADYGGFFKNAAVPDTRTGAVAPSKRISGTKTLYLRGTALLEPVPNLKARLKLNYTRDRNDGGVPSQLNSCPDGLVNFVALPAFPNLTFHSPQENCRADRTTNIVYLNPTAFPNVPNGGRLMLNSSQRFGTLEIDYDVLPDLTATSVTGTYNLKVRALTNAGNSGAAAPAVAADKYFRRREFTQELRLTSDFEGPLNFSAGAFYQDAEMKNDITLHGNVLYGRPVAPLAGDIDVDIKSVSAFGQLRYKLVPELEVAAGARWTHEKRRQLARTSIAGGALNTIPVPRLDSKNWSPEFTLTYTPTDDLTIFGSLKQAYKSGSYNLIIPITPGQNNSFGDEKVRGGEVGVKTRLADRQILTNLAFYYYKYFDLQVGANETASLGIPVIRTINAASAKVYGIDFDLSYRPQAMEGLEVRAAVNWNKAAFLKFDNAPCWGGQTIAEGCNLFPRNGLFQGQDISGRDLNRAPRWQGNLGFHYQMPAQGGLRIGVGADAQYSSKYWSNLGRRRDFIQPGFVKLNANLAVKGEDDLWEVALIGNNLTNKLRSGTCTNLNYSGNNISGIITGGPAKGPGGSDELTCTFDRGRELWLRLTLRPFGS